MAKTFDRPAGEVYKLAEDIFRMAGRWRSAASLNFNLRVMTMMRMMLEITMVLAVVLGMVMMAKVTAKENGADKTLPGSENGDNDSKDGDSE